MLFAIAYAIGFFVATAVLLAFVGWVRERRPKWRNALGFILGCGAGFCAGFALYLYGFSFAPDVEFKNFITPICTWTFIAFTVHMLAHTAASNTRVLATPYLINALVLFGAVRTRGIPILFALPLFALAALMYFGKSRRFRLSE